MILNPDTKKYIPKIFAAVLITTALLFAMNVRYYQKYADFVPVNAVITDVQRHITSSPSSDNKTSYTTCLLIASSRIFLTVLALPKSAFGSSIS